MEWIELGELADIETGKLNANAASDDGKYPFFTCADEILKIDEYAYDKECILVAGNGNLNVKYYSGKFNAYQRTYIIESKDKKRLNSKYLYYFMNIYMDKLRKMSIGGVIKYIKLGHLQTAKIPVPSLAIQEQIVEVLDRAQELIDKRRAQIQAMDSLIESIFYTMFGDPVRNEKGWEVKELGEYIKILTDYHANGSYKILKNHVELLDKKSYALMIRTTDLESKNFKEDVKYISKEAYDFLEKSKVYPNDIIINKIGSAGQVYIMPDLNCKVSLGMNQFLLRMNSELKHIYIYYLFNVKSGEMLIKSKAKGAVTKTINKNSIRSITIPIPPLDLQNEFAQKVELIEREKEVLEESLELLEENYRSIMDRAFKGELFN